MTPCPRCGGRRERWETRLECVSCGHEEEQFTGEQLRTYLGIVEKAGAIQVLDRTRMDEAFRRLVASGSARVENRGGYRTYVIEERQSL